MINKLGIGVPLGLAGATIGFSEIGEAVGSDALQSAGETTGKFIAPAIGITMGGFVIKQLRDLKQTRKEDKNGISKLL